MLIQRIGFSALLDLLKVLFEPDWPVRPTKPLALYQIHHMLGLQSATPHVMQARFEIFGLAGSVHFSLLWSGHLWSENLLVDTFRSKLTLCSMPANLAMSIFCGMILLFVLLVQIELVLLLLLLLLSSPLWVLLLLAFDLTLCLLFGSLLSLALTSFIDGFWLDLYARVDQFSMYLLMPAERSLHQYFCAILNTFLAMEQYLVTKTAACPPFSCHFCWFSASSFLLSMKI